MGGKYIECKNCKNLYECEHTDMEGCFDGDEYEEKTMEEKKLTDEELNELIKKLEYQSWAQNCPELSQAAYMLKCQKSEIERLTEEKKTLIWLNQDLGKQVVELTEENGWLSKECNKTTDECAELQKQVDELKAYAEDIYKKAIDREEDAYSLGFDKGKEQAVNDTAKEIFTDIDKAFSLYYPHGQIPYNVFQDVIKQLAKKKGVEVE